MPDTIGRFTSVFATAGTFGAVVADHLAMNGSWQYPLLIGEIRLWADASTGRLRVKSGSNPSSETDGTFIGEA